MYYSRQERKKAIKIQKREKAYTIFRVKINFMKMTVPEIVNKYDLDRQRKECDTGTSQKENHKQKSKVGECKVGLENNE